MGKYDKNKIVNRQGSNASVRKRLIVLISVFAVLLIAAIALLVILSTGASSAVDEIPVQESTAEQTISTSLETETQTIPTTVETTIVETTEPVTETTTAPTEEPTETDSHKTTYTPPAVTPTVPAVVIPEVTIPPKVVLSLPYTIPGTNLVLERIAAYDGVFLEDGSDVELTGVAMVLVHNAGSQPVEYANISMKYDDKVLNFEVSGLSAGARVACQEKNRAGCSNMDLVECTADVAVLDTFGMASDQVTVVDNGDNTLTVTNLTGQNIVTVRIFYKYYMADENAYIGGITFTAKISDLGANESVVISPSHYASGASTVIMVRTYDEDV